MSRAVATSEIHTDSQTVLTPAQLKPVPSAAQPGPSQLIYPHPTPPAGAAPIEVAPGIMWLRLPLPYSIVDHVNAYLLKGEEGWIVVDTGPDLPEVREIWDQLFAGPFRGERFSAVVCTHFHVDHAGLAGYIADRWRIPLLMTYREYFTMCARRKDLDQVPWQIASFYREAGYPQDRLQQTLLMFRFSGELFTPPPSFTCLRDRDALPKAGGDWRVLTGAGHSPEQAMLFSAADKLLLSGDQILPRIASNVSVSAVNPGDDPLSGWFATLERLASLPPETLVLPAHGEPFQGVRVRAAELRDRNRQKLHRLLEICGAVPVSAYDLVPELFRPGLSDFNTLLALGECLAYVSYAVRSGMLQGTADADGVLRYRSVPEHPAGDGEISERQK